MKIAIIGHKRIPSNEGGIEKGVEQHAVRMVQRGNDVTVYNRGGHNVFGKEFDGKKLKKYKGINIVTVPTVKGAACVPIYSFLATIHAAFSRYDCVSFRASGSCAMIPLAKLFGLRVVASLHGIDSQRDKWGGFASKYLEFGERMAATKADVCLVLSKNMKEYIDTKYGVNSILFANGIDKPKSHAPEIIKEKYGLEKNEYILSLGRIVPEKGLQYGRSLRIPMKPLSTSRPLIWRRKSAAMYGVIQTAGAKRLPSQACSIVPIAAARCMSTAPTMASGFLNIPVPIIPKFRVGHYALHNTVSMRVLS